MAAAPQPVDPWSAGLMAAGSVAGKALDDKTNQTLNNSFSSAFDSSGWTVNTGDGATQSASAPRTSSTLGLGSLLGNPVILLALCAAAYYVLSKR
jgi:hypothetical protein